VGEEGRVVSPDTIAVGVFTLLGVVVGLFGERWVRRLGRVWCEVDAWYVARGRGTTAEERRLQVTFLNGKDLDVTVWDMRVEFSREGQLLDEKDRPYIYFVDERDQFSPLAPVDLPSGKTVERTISVTLGAVHSGSASKPEPDKLQAVQEADRVEFVASMVGARDIRRDLTAWQDVASPEG
jgi:hypothetical protein